MDRDAPLITTRRYQEYPAPDGGQFGNTYLRWTVLHASAVVVLATVPLWLSAAAPRATPWVNTGITAGFALVWLWVAVNAAGNFRRLGMQPVVPMEGVETARTRAFKHIVIVPCYTDPIEVLMDCLGSLLMQTHPERLIPVVAFEARTPDLERKSATVKAAFQDRFGDFLVTVHTIEKQTEIPGGCSNKNYALHQAHEFVKNIPEYQQTAVTVTTCDTDSLFSPQYFEVLEACYNKENPTDDRAARMCVWQPPLFYNWDLDKRPFFVRITGIMRSMMMLGGLISFNLNPMSIFSYPLELGLTGGFINPRYSVDDIIFKVRCMCATNQKIPILLMPAPVISGPTIGTTYWQEIDEWARQIRRWIVGSSESFHYFVMHWRGRPLAAGVSWFFMFFAYYAVLLCAGGVLTLLASVPLPWVEYPRVCAGAACFGLQEFGLVALVVQYVAFGVAFVIDYKAVRVMGIEEQVHPVRNIVHWLLSPVVLVVYSVISFYAIIKFIFRGKADAGHVMAAKEGFTAAAKQEELTGSMCRTTSFTRSTTPSGSFVNNMALQHRRPVVELEEGDTAEVLLKLPERFYFGSYAFDPRAGLK
mmetsp:Transcript_62778/g.144570  ORF Transcript_62778/g.144570 Transcript_62778/m.144570 type:complete len:588 (-) Transcript_62778:194-1957(-)